MFMCLIIILRLYLRLMKVNDTATLAEVGLDPGMIHLLSRPRSQIWIQYQTLPNEIKE